MPETETRPHVMRVGWSVDASPLALGEVPLSYGYGGTGRASCDNKFSHYGEAYSTGDVISCYIDLDAQPKAIFFAKNGKYLDVAFRLGSEAEGKVFYPHISVKNMRFIANFGGFNPYFPPVQGFFFIQHQPPEMLSLPPPPPRDRRECEVLMMIGLPSCGKTTWVTKYVKDHPEKKYNILGTNDILVKMKVMGLSRKRNYHGRWDALIKQATGILNEMLKVAKHKNRNYILDQTNVYPNARRRKMANFQGYHRVAVVLVNDNSVLMKRNAEVVGRDGKVVPESAFMEMKTNFTLPAQGDVFDEVWFAEESQERSQRLVKEFNEEGRRWKEDQKKRPAEDVQVKTERETDFKKPKYGESATLNQSGNQCETGQAPTGRHRDNMPKEEVHVGQHNSGSHPQNFNQGRPNFPVQEIHSGDAFRRGKFQQPGPNDYSQRQHQYNPPSHSRNEHDQSNNYGPPGRIQDDNRYPRGHQGNNPNYGQGGHNRGLPETSQFTESHSSWNEGWSNQGQSSNNFCHRQGGKGEFPFSGNNYNQSTNPQVGWGTKAPYQGEQINNREFQSRGQGGVGYSGRIVGNGYHRPGNPHRSQNETYLRSRNDNSSTQSVQSGSLQNKNTNESYYGRNQSGDHDLPQNYSYNDPSQGHRHDSSRWSAPEQSGFINPPQGYSSGGGWNSASGTEYQTSTMSQSNNTPVKMENSNHNQQRYSQRQFPNY